MNRIPLIYICLCLSLALSLGKASEPTPVQTPARESVKIPDGPPLSLAETISLRGVEGRIDHLAVDRQRQLLVVAALGNNTMEVIDLREKKLLRTIAGLSEPQGVVYAPELDRIFVANGQSGTCQIFSGEFTLLQSVKLGEDADNVRYDAAAGQIWVGYGAGALGLIDASNGKQLGDIPLAGHPESFQLEKQGTRIFVNVPQAQQIAVIDRGLKKVAATWPLKEAGENFPMALDESGRRLYIGCRQPPRVLVYNTDYGTITASLETGGDTDDMFYETAKKRLYVICGSGIIKTYQQLDTDNFTPLADIQTAPGARTGLFVPELGRLYLAVPHRGGQEAQIRVYRVN